MLAEYQKLGDDRFETWLINTCGANRRHAAECKNGLRDWCNIHLNTPVFDPSLHNENPKQVFDPPLHNENPEQVFDPPLHNENPEQVFDPPLHNENPEQVFDPPLHNENPEQVFDPPLHNENPEQVFDPSLHNENPEQVFDPPLHNENPEQGARPKRTSGHNFTESNYNIDDKLSEILSEMRAIRNKENQCIEIRNYVLNIYKKISMIEQRLFLVEHTIRLKDSHLEK